MTDKRNLRPVAIGSIMTLLACLVALLYGSTVLASSHERKLIGKGGAREVSPQPMMAQTPTTLDGYVAYMSDRLQLEAMKVRQPGVADVQLTIDKNGTVARTEVTSVEGSMLLRDHATRIVNQMEKFPPLPADTNADVLVMTTTLAFNYPSGELFDQYSQLPRR
jgi:Gram-negative bacterial TonB protein C-terminal